MMTIAKIVFTVDEFGMASGEGTLLDWLKHCESEQRSAFDPAALTLVRTESEFEADVARALQTQGFKALSQYPSCGFRIDLVAEKDGQRLAIECDGEIWHQGEHGALKVEDVQRQEILERAGWRVLRISYRRWRIEPAVQLSRVTRALLEMQEEDHPSAAGNAMESTPAESKATSISIDTNEAAILRAVRSGEHDRETVLSAAARVHLGKSRLGSQIRRSLEAAIVSLAQRGLVVVEEAEVFATEEGRTATLSVHVPAVPSGRRRSYRGYRRWS